MSITLAEPNLRGALGLVVTMTLTMNTAPDTVGEAMWRAMTDGSEPERPDPSGEHPLLAGLLDDLADAGRDLVLGLAARGPRSGILRVSRAENTEFEARLTASYERHYLSLVSYARRRGAADAEDVVQQAFATVWKRRLRPTEIDNLDAYVQTAVRHETGRALGRKRVDREHYGGDPAEFPPGDLGPVEHVADRVTLIRALNRLPQREREAVVLRMVWDLSVREAAECMAVSPGTVKRYCSDGLRKLSEWLRAA